MFSGGRRCRAATDPAQLSDPGFNNVGESGIGTNLPLHIAASFNAPGDLIEGLVDILRRVPKFFLGNCREIGINSIRVNLSLCHGQNPLAVKSDGKIRSQNKSVSSQ